MTWLRHILCQTYLSPEEKDQKTLACHRVAQAKPLTLKLEAYRAHEPLQYWKICNDKFPSCKSSSNRIISDKTLILMDPRTRLGAVAISTETRVHIREMKGIARCRTCIQANAALASLRLSTRLGLAVALSEWRRKIMTLAHLIRARNSAGRRNTLRKNWTFLWLTWNMMVDQALHHRRHRLKTLTKLTERKLWKWFSHSLPRKVDFHH